MSLGFCPDCGAWDETPDTVSAHDAAWLREATASVEWRAKRVTIRVVSGDRTLVCGIGPTFRAAMAAAREADERWRKYLDAEPDDAPPAVLPSGE